MKIFRIMWDICIGGLFSIAVFIILISTSKEISGLVTWDKSLFSLGVSILGLTIAGISIQIARVSIQIARDSDKRMAAMANLEFHEKIAVMEAYISDILRSGLSQETATEETQIVEKIRSANAERIYYDIKGAKQLKKYVDAGINEKLNQEINKLIETAKCCNEQYKELIVKLDQLKKEDQPQK